MLNKNKCWFKYVITFSLEKPCFRIVSVELESCSGNKKWYCCAWSQRMDWKFSWVRTCWNSKHKNRLSWYAAGGAGSSGLRPLFYSNCLLLFIHKIVDQMERSLQGFHYWNDSQAYLTYIYFQCLHLKCFLYNLCLIWFWRKFLSKQDQQIPGWLNMHTSWKATIYSFNIRTALYIFISRTMLLMMIENLWSLYWYCTYCIILTCIFY